MKKFTNNSDTQDQFEIKNPAWAFWVCLIAAVGLITAFFVLQYMSTKQDGASDKLIGAYLLLLISIAPAIGVYVCAREKLSYSNRVYTYRPPFGKTQIAKEGDIWAVKILTTYFHTKYGINNKVKIMFYDKNKNILIKMTDDGTVSKNEMLLKSLKFNGAKIIREEKFK